jgi:hypothetical protein
VRPSIITYLDRHTLQSAQTSTVDHEVEQLHHAKEKIADESSLQVY